MWLWVSKKPQEAQKARALWAMKAAKDRREAFYDPTRKDNVLERNKNVIGVVERTSQRSKCCAGQSIKLRGRSVLEVGSRLCGSKAAMAHDRVVSDLMLPLWEEVLWPFLDAWGQCPSTHNLYAMECPREIRAFLEPFIFLLKKEPTVLRELVRLGPSIRPHGELLFLLVQKNSDSEAFNSFIGDGFSGPRVEGRR